MKQITIITIIITLLSVQSCARKDNSSVTPQTTDELKINIISPTEDATYKKGDVIPLQAEISYDGELHGYIVRITDKESNIVFETEGHTHDDKINIIETWINDISSSTELEVDFIAVIDHDEHTKNKSVKVNTQP